MAVAIAPSTWSMTSIALRVVRELDRIAAVRRYPLKLRLDNAPEVISLALAEWSEQHGVTL